MTANEITLTYTTAEGVKISQAFKRSQWLVLIIRARSLRARGFAITIAR